MQISILIDWDCVLKKCFMPNWGGWVNMLALFGEGQECLGSDVHMTSHISGPPPPNNLLR